MIRNRIRFYGEELLAPRPNSKLEDHPLSAVRNCLFNIFAATLHIGGRFSIRNLRTHHDMVSGTYLSHMGREAGRWNKSGFCLFKVEHDRKFLVLFWIFSPMTRQPLLGQGFFIVEDSRSPSETPHSVWPLLTSNQLNAQTSTWRHTTLTRKRHPYSRRNSKPQSQQASGCRPTPLTVCPLVSAVLDIVNTYFIIE